MEKDDPKPASGQGQAIQGKFLLVEDDAEYRGLLERVLGKLGCECRTAVHGEEAVDRLQAESFDVVITDIQMPGLSGIDLLRLVKERYPGTDVMVMTGFAHDYTFTDVIRAGATDYLEKPFSRDAFEAKILRIVKERALLDDYHHELARRKEMEEALKRQSESLAKRVRELQCLYQVSNLIQGKRGHLEEVFQEVVDLIPSACQCPGVACARLCLGEAEFRSAGFQMDASRRVGADITAKGQPVGIFEVCLAQEERREGDEEGLLAELVREIAQKIGDAIDLQRAERELLDYFGTLEEAVRKRSQELHVTQAALEAVFQGIPDGIVSVDEAMVVTHFNATCGQTLRVEVGSPFVAGGTIFQAECRRVLHNTLLTREPVIDYRVEIHDPDTARRVVLVSTSVLQDEEQANAGALMIIHDITRLADLENQLQERRRFRQMIGKCQQLQEVYAKIRRLASVDTTVLVTGESGTGKELVVETLHASGNRADKPLVKVNCSALPENLLESELFGHVRGAFTGATKDRVGRVQAAEGGILFLDEIGDLSSRMQLKLLRFLEVKEYERVGESLTRRADVRVLTATNVDLARKVREGLFREDLYYRLKVMVLDLPPLRERRQDIPFLVDHFLSFYNGKFQKTISVVAPEAMAILMEHGWPGNIRELKHVVEHACLLSAGDEITTEHLPKDLARPSASLPSSESVPAALGQPSRALTREGLLAALRQTDGNKAKTARLLKMSRATLYSKLREFGLAQDPA